MQRLFLLLSLLFHGHSQASWGEESSPEQIDAVAEARASVAAPAMGAAVAAPEGVVAITVDGVRRIGTDNKAAASDAFHIGSVTKTMTATIAGQLVEEGALDWNSRVIELLPEIRAGARPEYRQLTLAHLLAHEGGLQALTDDAEIDAMPELHGGIVDQRRQLSGWLLQQPVVAPVGDSYSYSNGGFVIAAAMMEAVTGETWEALMRERIFIPLRMPSAGFGWPGEGGRGNAFLWGHRPRGEQLVPVDPDGDYQLPQVLAPAGDVHASLSDMGRYAAAYLRAWQGDDGILASDTLSTMFRERVNSGLGWGVQSAFGFDMVAVYAGSADTFFCLVAVIPEAERAVLVGSNAAGEETEASAVALLRRVVEEYTTAPEPDVRP